MVNVMEEKNTIQEMNSLMRRMEEVPGGYTGTLDEVTCKWRDVVGEEVFHDVLESLKQGNRVTFGYIDKAKIEVPKGKKLNPTTKRMNQFDDYEALGKSLGEEGIVVNVLKLTIYNMPWQTKADITNKYQEWQKHRDELAGKFGVEVKKPMYKTTTINFGDNGGISQYAGNNADLSKHTYTNLNMSGIRPINTQYFLVMNDGHIRPIDVSKLKVLPYKGGSNGIIDRLRAAGATEEDVKPLLNMQYQRFEHSKVLFISATPDNGIPTLLINNKLSNSLVGETGANKEDIIKLAQDRYAKFMDRDVKFVGYDETNQPE